MRELAVYWIICFIVILHFYDVEKNGRIGIRVALAVFFISFLLPLIAIFMFVKKLMKK